MPLVRSKFSPSPPPLPVTVKSNAARKAFRIFSFVVSVFVFWFVLLLLPALFVVGPGEGGGPQRTLFDVWVEERSMAFMLANLFYFLLIPFGVTFIATNALRLPWWSYPIVPLLSITAIVAAVLFS